MLHTAHVELGVDAGVCHFTRTGFLFALTKVVVSPGNLQDNYFFVVMRSLSSPFFCIKKG